MLSGIPIASVVASEFLCFMINKFSKCPLSNLKSVLVDFYDDNEISVAMELLHAELLKLMSEVVPRLIKRKGDIRSR